MDVKRILKQALAVAIGCSPATMQPAAAPLPVELHASASVFSCIARQPDLSVGLVVYLKGQATLNGSSPVSKGTIVRLGDQLSTASDGFIALEVVGGNLVNVPPATTIDAGCTASAMVESVDSAPYFVGFPHMAGAVRG